MRYTVDAWLEKGMPRLRLMDERGSVRLDWVCREGATKRDCTARTELQRLFKDLFLLAGAARVCASGPIRAALADACLRCGECVQPPTRSDAWVQNPALEAKISAEDGKQPEQ